MKKSFLLLLLTLSTYLYSQEEFQYATTSKKGIKYYYKIENDIMGVTTNFWLKYDSPTKKIKTKKGKYIVKEGGFTMAYMSISCLYNTYETNNLIMYDADGNVIGKDDIPTFSQPIPPDSVIDGIAQKICRKD